jgi:formiminotetrahydrofolate cyclodeaminase
MAGEEGAMDGTDGSLWGWSLEAFRERLAGDAPTPGGGSAAIVTAASGLALVLMALRVTAKRADAAPEIAGLVARGATLMPLLAAHADADIAVFDRYMAALRLRRATEEEKERRRAALAEASAAATDLPLEAAAAMVEALDLAAASAPLAALAIVSDVAAGAATLSGALAAVLYAVDVNLRTLTDEAARAAYRSRRESLLSAGMARAIEVDRVVRARLAG